MKPHNFNRIVLITFLLLVSIAAISQAANAADFTNGNFESGTPGWTMSATESGIQDYSPAHSGTKVAWVTGDNGAGYISQSLDTTGKSNVSIWLVGSLGASKIRVYADSTELTVTNEGKIGATSTYAQYYAFIPESLRKPGTTIKFIRGTEDIYTNIVVFDDVSLTEPETSTPAANFTSNITSGYSPLYVQFTDTSNNTPTSHQWNFGDGTANSTLQNPVHQFTFAGVYNVTLTVSNTAGTSTLSKTNLITVANQEGSYNNQFTLNVYADNFGNGTYPVQAAFAVLAPLYNYTLFDKVIWRLDGATISDSDISGGWVNVKEGRYNVDHWETYWPQYAEDWQDVTRATVLNNTIHFKTAGSHTVTALAYYGGLQVADVSAVVSVDEFGSLSSNYIAVLDISDDSLVDGATVQFTDNMTGETTTITSSTYSDYVTLTKGHLYSVGVIKTGYATYNSTLLWPDTTGASIPIKITPDGMATPGGQVYVNFHVTSAATGQPIAQTYVLVKYPGYSAVWPIGSDGYVSVPVDQSVTVVYTIFHATEQYYRINSSVAITSSSVNIEKKLTTKTATINPATPTPIPTAAATPTPIPGTSYTPYTDTQREETMFETFDMLLGAAPALVGLCIVCTIMGLMDKMRPRRR